MTETTTTPNEAEAVTEQALGELEHLDPNDLQVGDNIREYANLNKPFLDSIAEHGVLVPLTAIRRPDGVVEVRNGQRRTFPGKSPCCLGRCWPRAEVGAVTTWPGLGQSWRHTIVAQMLRVRCRGHGSNRRKQR